MTFVQKAALHLKPSASASPLLLLPLKGHGGYAWNKLDLIATLEGEGEKRAIREKKEMH